MSSPSPLVTVYVTNHNYGQFLAQAVDSVLCQAMKDFELILIDDGSTDNSRHIIEGYKKTSRVRIIYQRHRGLNVTNNIALRAARGKYIMRLDADDYLDPNALLILSSALEQDPGLGLVFPDYYLVDVHGAVFGLQRRHTIGKDARLLDMPAHGACTLIRRQFLLDVGGYDESFSCQDGYDLWVKFVHRYKVANVNLPLFYYRQHGCSLSRNERRILNTRAAIKRKHVRRGAALCAVAIVPVRGASADPSSVVLHSLARGRVLDGVIRAALRADSVVRVVVTSSDLDVRRYVRRRYAGTKDFLFMDRSEDLARLNVGVEPTARLVLKHPDIKRIKPDALVLLTPEYPFMESRYIDDTVHTLSLFNVDSVVTVRPETAVMYQHDGRGFRAILNQDRFTKLERDALYRYAGGVTAFRVAPFLRRGVLEHERLGHVVVDQRSAFIISSDLDLVLARHLAEETAL